MNDDSILGATLGQVGLTVKKVGQQIVQVPEEMGKDVAGQVGSPKQNEATIASAEGSVDPRGNKTQWSSDEERIKYLKGLYGSEKKVEDKSPEEQKKLMQLRQQLHKQVYYDPTFNRPKRQEERPAEKIEQEKKQEMIDLQKKEDKKPKPLAVTREQNKAEMFRGASG